ncbi:putative polyhydroxybutyrate depolymerase [Aspergillus alliaceus]|uniref:putative polyhydroxybutyrate depolymerase n=1 Tax=Petromyces alliaceus TaxID=209559 RepID=UPI0012A485B1|nr:Alpha/Beta hydrolase protein [Aspergillus alliaceus]KAB8231700.1 Alpha/Beta hydrolase protein [Aspergillus alliaceus]
MVAFNIGLGIVCLVSGTSAGALSAYNVDPNYVSVSGISSGGFMAAQLGIAHSSTFSSGFGVFAGGPFDCARAQPYITCMYNMKPSIVAPTANMKSWSGKQIDDVANLQSRKIYMQVGSIDTTVGPGVMQQLRTQILAFANQSETAYITTPGASHTFPTDFDQSGNNPCGIASSPYISNCGYDGAGAVLQWIYGKLNARNSNKLDGQMISFEQRGSYGGPGMDNTGYLYVPKRCVDGSTVCKLHVALHGCLQSHDKIGTKFIDNTGYDKWADTNNMIIVFPQAVTDYALHPIWGGMMAPNPNACWDWIGWYGDDADQKGGAQMTAIVNQVKQITSGYKGQR